MTRIRAVGVTLPAFDPLPGAKFSMCTKRSIHLQLRRKRSRRRLDGLANIVDNLLDERRVVPFCHYPDQRLGPGLADHDTAPALKLLFGFGDPLFDAGGFERPTA